MFEFFNSIWQTILAHPEYVAISTIPPVTAFVTWAHVWMALKMLFFPINFWGIKIDKFPFGLQGLGWQGIVPSKAGKISGVIVDQALSKLGSLDEFFQAMEPEEMADYIAKAVDDDLESLIDEVMMDRSSSLWSNMPYAVKRRIYAYGHEQLPLIVKDLVVDLTNHVEDLVDMKQMIVNKMEGDRQLMVEMFLKVGQKEINFIWHISAVIGYMFGMVQMALFVLLPYHWTVPFFAMVWGVITNWIAIWMVFNPVHPHYFRYPKFFHWSKLRIFEVIPLPVPEMPHIAKYNWQGGFMKRQDEVSEVFAEIVVNDLVTIDNIMNEMMFGHRSLQTRELMKGHLYDVMESPVVSTTLKMGLGRRELGQLRNTIIDKSITATMVPIRNPELISSRASKIFGLFRDRIRALSPKEFQNLLRPAFQEDETTLIILGGITGFLAGWIHLMVVFL